MYNWKKSGNNISDVKCIRDYTRHPRFIFPLAVRSLTGRHFYIYLHTGIKPPSRQLLLHCSSISENE